MAVQYRLESSPSKLGNEKNEFLYKAGCAIQACLDDPSCAAFVACARFGLGGGDRSEDIIQCSSYPDQQAVIQWIDSLEAPPGLKLVDYIYGSREDVSQALVWPD